MGARAFDPRFHRTAAGWGAGIAFLLAFLWAAGLFQGRGLHDTDAAYHLAVARAYAEQGALDGLPWTRMSLAREGFGDKEFLFHRLLAPFTGVDPDATLAGGRWALALLNALLAALVAYLALRGLGWWGFALPFWLPLASTEVAWRLVRLRPELPAAFLLTVAVVVAARGQGRWLVPLAWVFTWSYTAFHAFGGLIFLIALVFWLRERRFPWGLPLYTGLGLGLGLLSHPQFPHNLQVWAVQNLAFFQQKGSLPVGTEIRPNFTDVALMVHLGWLLMMVALWRARVADPQASAREGESQGRGRQQDRRRADAFAVAAFCFTVLYLLMSRFALYAIPFLTLWLVTEIRARGQRIGPWVALPAGRRLPLAVAAGLALLLSAPVAVGEWQRFQERTFLGPHGERLADWRALAAAIPDGAPVAADWGPTGTYMLWAPQGRYLNALDPVFMAVPYPEAYQALQQILQGQEPDIPFTAVAQLESPFLAYPRAPRPVALEARLAEDPRVEVLYQGFHGVIRFRPAPGVFVLDWEIAGAPLHPRAPPAEGAAAARSLAGYIDLRHRPEAADNACVTLQRRETTVTARRERFELAPAGASVLALDGRPLVGVRGALGAVLGRGVEILVDLPPGEHLWTLSTCPEVAQGRFGFYMRHLGPRMPPGK